jgi:hypothetical protein
MYARNRVAVLKIANFAILKKKSSSVPRIPFFISTKQFKPTKNNKLQTKVIKEYDSENSISDFGDSDSEDEDMKKALEQFRQKSMI